MTTTTHLLRLVVLGLLASLMGACNGPQGAPDWPAWEREAELASLELHDVATIFAAADEPDTAEQLDRAAAALEVLHRALERFNAGAAGPLDVRAAVDLAVETLAAFAEQEDDPVLQAAVVLARGVARRVGAYLPQAPPAVVSPSPG